MFLGRAVLSSFSVALGVAASALLFLVPAALSDTSNVIWSSPTPADQARFTVDPGKSVTFSMTASSEETGGIVQITPAAKLPKGALFNSSDGVAARATFKWKPDLAGDYTVKFTATQVGTTVVAPTLTYLIHVKGIVLHYPLTTKLTTDKTAHWAQVLSRAPVYSQPKASSRQVTKLDTMTTDGTHNIVLVLSQTDVADDETWYRVRLPILPNNSTGWVQAQRPRSAVRRAHAPLRRPRALDGDAEAGRQDDLHDDRRRRALDLAHAARRVLHPRQAHELRRPVLRAGRVRHERPLGDA